MLQAWLPLGSIVLAAVSVPLVHERSLCMPTCANEALRGCAPSEEHSRLNSRWKLSSRHWGFEVYINMLLIERGNKKELSVTRGLWHLIMSGGGGQYTDRTKGCEKKGV